MKKIALWPALPPSVPICATRAGETLFSSVRQEGRDDGPAPAAGQFRNPTLTGFYAAHTDSRATIHLRFQLDDARLDVQPAEGGKLETAGMNVDASVLSVVEAGGFTGATFGPYAYVAK